MAVLELNDQGEQVTAVQTKLVEQGYFVGDIDGEYGRKTVAAVAYLQSCHGLDIDGKAGPQVFGILDIGEQAAEGEANIELGPPQNQIVNDPNNLTCSVEAHSANPPEIRLVSWFRAGTEEHHSEQQVQPEQGTMQFELVEIPQAILDHSDEREVHMTVYAFDLQGNQLAEAAGNFTLDIPDS